QHHVEVFEVGDRGHEPVPYHERVMSLDLAYRVYERRLLRNLRNSRLPQHVGVVVDGNRRYARAHGHEVSDGYRDGAQKIHELLDWCDELNIPYVTIWMLSTDNLRRDAAEIGNLVRIIGETVEWIGTDPQNVEREVKVTCVGALDMLPDELRAQMKEAEEASAGRNGMHVQVAVGYGGRQEITEAFRQLLLSAHEQGHSARQIAEG